jgi:glycosyltransferase involved in cell wall biosynthesis
VPKPVTMLFPYYPPDVAADGQLFALLARELVKLGHPVKVLTWRPRYQGVVTPAPARETVDGVEIRRMWAPRTGKSLLGRLISARWVAQTGMYRALFNGGVLIIPSSNPGLAMVGWWLSFLGRRFIYVLHDIHPELGLALGHLKPGLLASMIARIQRRALRRGVTVTLTDGMREKALAIQPKADVHVIPNWVDTAAIKPIPKAESVFAKANDLVHPFAIQYSGNLGLLHPLDGLTKAMAELPDCVLTYIGRGAKLQPTKVLAGSASNVKFFDYQPLAALADSLAACDLAVVAIEPGADRLAMPSKLQGILASGRPILALAPAESELASFVIGHECGIVVSEFNKPQAIAAVIKRLRADPATLANFAQNARAAAERLFSVKLAAERYSALIG